MPKCKICGARIEDGTAVCPSCGAKVVSSSAVPAAGTNANVAAGAAKPRSHRRTPLLSPVRGQPQGSSHREEERSRRTAGTPLSPLRKRRTGELPLLPRLRGNAGSWHRHNTGIPKSITIGSHFSQKACAHRCSSREHAEYPYLLYPRISFGNNRIF